MIIKKSCSLCQQSNLEVKYKLSKFNILRCKNCGLLTRDIILNKKESEDLYKKGYFCKLQKDYFSAGMSRNMVDSLRVIDFKERLRKIKKFGNIEKGKILDIGCATGIFLKIAKDDGWQTYGVEISRFAGDFAKNTYRLEVFIGELKQAKYKSNTFDVATGFDFIEHVEDPRELIREVKRILKPRGYIVLQTTMVDSLLFVMAGILYRFSFGKINKIVDIAYPIHHSNHFSRKTLVEILKKEGFKVINQENIEIFYEETSLPKITLPFLKILSSLSQKSGRTIESFVLAQKP